MKVIKGNGYTIEMRPRANTARFTVFHNGQCLGCYEHCDQMPSAAQAVWNQA